MASNETQAQALTGSDIITTATASGASMRIAAKQAKDMAERTWAELNPDALCDVISALLTRIESAFKSHAGNVSERHVFTRSYMVRVREDMAALRSMSETGTAEYAKLLDDLRGHFALMTAQAPVTVQALDAGKRVRNDIESDFLRGLRSFGSQSLRLAPAYIPDSEQDALADIAKQRAQREAAQVERNRKRLADTAAQAIKASEAAPSDTALTQAASEAKQALDAFNAAHPLAITGEAGK